MQGTLTIQSEIRFDLEKRKGGEYETTGTLTPAGGERAAVGLAHPAPPGMMGAREWPEGAAIPSNCNFGAFVWGLVS